MERIVVVSASETACTSPGRTDQQLGIVQDTLFRLLDAFLDGVASFLSCWRPVSSISWVAVRFRMSSPETAATANTMKIRAFSFDAQTQIL